MYENLFLVAEHQRLIMRTLYSHFKKNYNYEVGTEEEQLTFVIMKDVIQKYPAQRGEKPKPYIKKSLRKFRNDLA